MPRRWAAFDACLDGLAKLYHTNQIQTLFFVMTILTLVGNSIRHAYLRPRADFGVDVTLTAFLGLFAIEIALLSLKEPGYWGSVFMAFDVLGAASIVLDVPWLQGGRGSPLMESSSARGTTRTARAVRLIRFTTHSADFSAASIDCPESCRCLNSRLRAIWALQTIRSARSKSSMPRGRR